MIGVISVRQTADQQNFPLRPVAVFIGSSMTLGVDDVPRMRDNIAVTGVGVAAENATGAIVTVAAKFANGIWTATIPASHFAAAGIITAGLTITASGTDENGVERTWSLGRGNLSVLPADGVPVPGETMQNVHLRDSLPSPPLKGDLYDEEGVWKIYNGEEWVAIGGGSGPSPSTSAPAMDGQATPGVSEAYARGDHRHPTDTSRASTADATLTERGFTWTMTPDEVMFNDELWPVGSPYWSDEGIDGPGWYMDQPASEPVKAGSTDPDATSLSFYISDAGTDVTAVRTALPGYRLGPDAASNPNRNKLLASEAEAESLRAAVAGKQDALSSQQLANLAAVPGKADDSAVVHKSGAETISGLKTFTQGALNVSDSKGHLLIMSKGFLWTMTGGQEPEILFPTTNGTIALAASPSTPGHLAALDAQGNPVDSGKKPADFATAAQGQKADDSVQRELDNANPSAKTAATIGVRSTEAAADRGQASLTVGDHPKASGKNAVATGTWTQATGQDAHAEGNLSQATNYGAHAEGNNTQATGAYAHAEGTDTVASGLVSHAEGNYTTVEGTGAHVEGMFSKASGIAAHAEGSNLDRLADLLQAAGASAEIVALFRQAATAAAGSFSHTEGLVTATSEMGSHAQGFRASDGGNPFSFVWQGYSGVVPTAAQMQALLSDPTSQDAQAALQCLVTALTARAAYTSKGRGTFCVNPAPQGGSTDPKSGFFIGDEPFHKALRYSFHTASQDTPFGYWNITEVPSGVDRSDVDIYWDSDYEDWCIFNSSTGDSYFIGRHDENDKSPISYNGYVADWVVGQNIYGLADRAVNTATIGSTVTKSAVTLPAATTGRSRDFFIDLTIEATDAPTLTFVDPATSTTINVAFGADSLADIAPGYNLVLFMELPNNRWLVSVKHEEAS